MSATAAVMSKQRILTTAMLAVAAASTMVACSSSSDTGSTGANAPNTTAPVSTPPIPTPAVQALTLTPHSGLKNAQAVQVVGKGYTAGKVYVVTECADKGAATVAADCNQPGIKTGTADATGTVTVSFPVAKHFGSNKIVCSASQACVVSVATADQLHPSELASAKITFA